MYVYFLDINFLKLILPIVKLNGVFEALQNTYVVAISPIVGGSAVSGPANKFMNALGFEATSYGIASLYKSFLNKMVIDLEDKDLEDITQERWDMLASNAKEKALETIKFNEENIGNENLRYDE